MGSPKGKGERGQYLLAVGLGHYKWYKSQTSDDVPAKGLSPKGGGPEAVCQQTRWAQRKGVDRLEKGTKHSLQGCENLSLVNAF